MKIDDVRIGVSKTGDMVLYTVDSHNKIADYKKITDDVIDTVGTFMDRNQLSELDYFKNKSLTSRMNIAPTLFWITDPDKVMAVKKFIGDKK